jgi:hypothetical protein
MGFPHNNHPIIHLGTCKVLAPRGPNSFGANCAGEHRTKRSDPNCGVDDPNESASRRTVASITRTEAFAPNCGVLTRTAAFWPEQKRFDYTVWDGLARPLLNLRKPTPRATESYNLTWPVCTLLSSSVGMSCDFPVHSIIPLLIVTYLFYVHIFVSTVS